MAEKKKIVKISDITTFGDRLRRSISARITGFSKKLSGLVKLGTATDRNGQVSIRITVGNADKNKTGMFRAFEYGSGLHATRGTRAKYRISPKNKKRLAFNWPGATSPFKRGRKMAGELPDGRLSFFYVEHPGVRQFQGRGLIKPAIEATMAKASKELALSVRRNIKDILAIQIKEINKTLSR